MPAKKTPAKKGKKPAKKTPAIDVVGKVLNMRQDQFCRNFTQNNVLFDNATLSYADAYDYKLDQLSKDDAIYEPDEEYDDEEEEHGRRLRKRYHLPKLLVPSSYDRAYNVCSVEGSRLLRNPKAQIRIRELLLEDATDACADSELMWLMKQRKELGVKMSAIAHHNKLMGRMIDKVELTGQNGGPVEVDDKRKTTLDSLLTKNAKP